MDDSSVKQKRTKNRRKMTKKSLVEVVVKDKDKSLKKNKNSEDQIENKKKPYKTGRSMMSPSVHTAPKHGTVGERALDKIRTNTKRKLNKSEDAINAKKIRPNESDMLSENLNFIPNSSQKDRNSSGKSKKKVNSSMKVSEKVGKHAATAATQKRKIADGDSTISSAKVPKVQDENPSSPEADTTGIEKQDRDERTVFVGNLPLNTDKKKLQSFFKLCGAIESVRLRGGLFSGKKGSSLAKKFGTMNGEKDSNQSGYAYVVFKHTSGFQNARKLNGAEYEGHKLRIDTSSKEKELDTKYTVFLGNLPYDITDDALLDHFSRCEPIDYVRVIRDSATGKGKGFGYIKFTDSSGFCLAMNMNDSQCGGRAIRVKAATTNQKPQINHGRKGHQSEVMFKKKQSNKPKHMARKLEQKRMKQVEKSTVKKSGITKASNRIKSSFPVVQPKKFKKRKFDKTTIVHEKVKKSPLTKKAQTFTKSSPEKQRKQKSAA